MIKAVIGSNDDYGALNVTNMNDDRDLESLDNVICNIGDDSGDNPHVANNELFKSLVTGGTVRIDAKFQKPYSTVIRAQIVQATNDIPTFDGQAKGINRRVLFIPFMHQIKSTDKNYINNNQMQYLVRNKYVREYILYKAIHQPIFDTFSNTKGSQALKQRFVNRDNHALAIAQDFNKFAIPKVPRILVYKIYKNYCSSNGFRYVSSPKFYEAFLSAEKGLYSSKREYISNDDIQLIQHYIDGTSYANVMPPKAHTSTNCFVLNKN